MKTMVIMLTMSIAAPKVIAQTTFMADMKDARNLVKFESEAPLETIVGLSNRIGVTVSINIADITKNPKGKATVDLNAFKTGIELRDKDMKAESFLNVAKYPTTDFVLTSFTNASSTELKDGNKITATANGKLTFHGVTKEISVPVVLMYFKESGNTKVKMKGNLLSVNSTFSIKMTDYGLTIPALLFYKLKDEIKISISFVATDAEKTIADVLSEDDETDGTIIIK